MKNNPVNCDQQGIIRPVANFSPSLWGDLFTSCSVDHSQVSECYAKEIDVLKEKVRGMIVADDKKLQENLILNTDTIERLSLLRQHAFDVPSCIFDKFTDNNGKFKENLKGDIKGLLSLYEASHLRYHGEAILDEGLIFSTTHLESIDNSSTFMGRQVRHALEQSLQRGIPRIEAHNFIAFYEEDESKDESLLRLAKLDFNLLQMLHKKELYEIIRWWKELDLVSKLSYARDRVVECYFWTLGVYFEPQYSRARVMLAKTIAMISIIDDTYDSYGTLDELAIFTDAIERIECYMNEYGVSEEEAMKEFNNIAENAWKDMNEEFVKIKDVSMEITKRIVNLARLIDVVYKHNQDGYTHPEKVLKPCINGLLVEYFKI
ncbi:hypothetical protein DH2020_036498 [Rehmannia glutinosa]|uniref:(+)-delta-cadinene synthase n=1 Tax=Rehmannia glutinosa TaxID=99300 RepID=A0ABR0V6Q3_REHGL